MKQKFFVSCLLGLWFGVALLPTNSLFAQQLNIRGQVLGENGEPLAGANIRIEGTLQGTTTDYEGNFALRNLPAGNYTLRCSYVGYIAQNQTLTLSGEDASVSWVLVKDIHLADEVVVSATRATEKSAIAYTNISREELAKQNLGQDIPVLLNFSPSVVSTSDAGAGIGYTGLRIRGSDATRINVTLNGIPLNDAESQGVFWVNMPDFASSVSSIQIQRGVGTSTNGAGAFGATVNIQSNQLRREAYAEINNSFGSFNTWKHTLMAGTGLIKDKFTVDARLSRVRSDGFIERAFADLRSFYVSGAYYGKKSMFRVNIFSGREQTYQAWYGVPEAQLRAGNRRFNQVNYDNETDNYQQDHYQFFYNQELSKGWSLQAALHYTKGRGYFEQFRTNDDLAFYNIAPATLGNDTIRQTDLIRRLWLDNDFYGLVYSVQYEGKRLQLTLGGGWNRYTGKHFGEVIWARFAGNSNIRQRYYDNDAAKTDLNFYAKAFYQITTKLNAFVDLQVRSVGYNFLGKAVDSFGARDVQQSVDLFFFNPKIGLNFQWTERWRLYGFVGIGNREPNRDDFTQSSAASRPQPETLQNLELGLQYQSTRWAFSVNGFGMNYQNQLVLTGQINDVGAFTRRNIPNSYRIGIEIESAWRPLPRLTWQANLTLSRNRVVNFTEFISDFDNGGQVQNTFRESDIAFSPNIVGGSQLEYNFPKGIKIALLSKYVGRQFLDNTANPNRQLNAYFTHDLRLIYTLTPRWMEEISLSLLVNNLSNERYESNGYTFSFLAQGQQQTQNFYFPQAGTHFLLALGLKF
ncbi:MAG TPA: TonB-dependent receptor [Microscillaceae bacterium]|jgi:iron complex outermembrane receptor protein|nr:TonB-dependent receptor [Microscillaceae bacterium]